MKKSITLITLLSLLTVSFVSCGKKDEPVVVLPLNVASITPANGATAVEYIPTIKVEFDKDINQATISGIQLLNPANVAVDCNVTVVGPKSVNIIPKANLDMGIKYTVKVSGVKAVDTGSLAKDVTSTFTTKTVPLTIVSITPADKTTEVALNTKIVIVFSKKLKNNVIDFIALTPASGTATWSSVYDGNVTVTITPTGGMVKNMNYYISYFAGITALDGEALPTQAEYRITTGNF